MRKYVQAQEKLIHPQNKNVGFPHVFHFIVD